MTLQSIILLFLFTVFIGCEENSNALPKETSEQTTLIQRHVFTPSGDWGGAIEYIYDQNGDLIRFTYEFSTFNGYDKETEEFSLTNCIRKYDVSEGKSILISKVTTDNKTGKVVDRDFYDPKIEHWMTIADAKKELPKQPIITQ